MSGRTGQPAKPAEPAEPGQAMEAMEWEPEAHWPAMTNRILRGAWAMARFLPGPEVKQPEASFSMAWLLAADPGRQAGLGDSS